MNANEKYEKDKSVATRLNAKREACASLSESENQ
jgi:hypothetical protein